MTPAVAGAVAVTYYDDLSHSPTGFQCFVASVECSSGWGVSVGGVNDFPLSGVGWADVVSHGRAIHVMMSAIIPAPIPDDVAAAIIGWVPPCGDVFVSWGSLCRHPTPLSSVSTTVITLFPLTDPHGRPEPEEGRETEEGRGLPVEEPKPNPVLIKEHDERRHPGSGERKPRTPPCSRGCRPGAGLAWPRLSAGDIGGPWPTPIRPRSDRHPTPPPTPIRPDPTPTRSDPIRPRPDPTRSDPDPTPDGPT